MPAQKETKYTCTSCGRTVGRDNLKVKRAQFREMGVRGSVLLTRTIGWLCTIEQDDGSQGCLYSDPDWNREPFSASPGHVNMVEIEEPAAPAPPIMVEAEGEIMPDGTVLLEVPDLPLSMEPTLGDQIDGFVPDPPEADNEADDGQPGKVETFSV